LRRQLGGRRLRLTDERPAEACRASVPAGPGGPVRGRDDRHAGHVDPMAPATHRPQMDLRQARNDASRCGRGNPRVDSTDGGGEPQLGLHRIQGALKNVGHRVGRSTTARILRAVGIPPAPERPTSWQTFLRAHWGEIAAADFFTTEVWTWHGLVTFYTVFVIDLASRRVQILGSTPHPDETFMCQSVRNFGLVDADGCRVLIRDRDAKWSRVVRVRFQDAEIRVVRTPYRAPNANAYAERFVRSITEECLSRLIPLGERHHRRAVAEFVAHYHRERNHQGLDNDLIEGRCGRATPPQPSDRSASTRQLCKAASPCRTSLLESRSQPEAVRMRLRSVHAPAQVSSLRAEQGKPKRGVPTGRVVPKASGNYGFNRTTAHHQPIVAGADMPTEDVARGQRAARPRSSACQNCLLQLLRPLRLARGHRASRPLAPNALRVWLQPARFRLRTSHTRVPSSTDSPRRQSVLAFCPAERHCPADRRPLPRTTHAGASEDATA
jgi:hypothetical protein